MPAHPTPSEFLARARHYELQGQLAPGTSVATTATKRELIPISGLLRCRIRIELTLGDGTLRARFARPVHGVAPDLTFEAPGSAAYSAVHTTGNPNDVACGSIDTEYMMEIDDLYGEAYLLVEYIDTSGGSTIKRCVFSAL